MNAYKILCLLDRGLPVVLTELELNRFNIRGNQSAGKAIRKWPQKNNYGAYKRIRS